MSTTTTPPHHPTPPPPPPPPPPYPLPINMVFANDLGYTWCQDNICSHHDKLGPSAPMKSKLTWNLTKIQFYLQASQGGVRLPALAMSIALVHWGRVTHIYVSKLTIIGSDDDLSPGRRQAIIWTNAGILLIRTLGTNFSEILGKIPAFSFKKMHFKMSSAKWRPFFLGLNVLIRMSKSNSLHTGHRWTPFTKASDAELWCFLWSAPEQTVE